MNSDEWEIVNRLAARMGAKFVPKQSSSPATEYGRKHTDGSRSGGQPLEQASAGEVPISIEMLRFLRGEGPLMGYNFGDRPDGKGFWWREYLPHEPAPVDPLREIIIACCDKAYTASVGGEPPAIDPVFFNTFMAELRQRGVTAEPK